MNLFAFPARTSRTPPASILPSTIHLRTETEDHRTWIYILDALASALELLLIVKCAAPENMECKTSNPLIKHYIISLSTVHYASISITHTVYLILDLNVLNSWNMKRDTNNILVEKQTHSIYDCQLSAFLPTVEPKDVRKLSENSFKHNFLLHMDHFVARSALGKLLKVIVMLVFNSIRYGLRLSLLKAKKSSN